MENTVIVNEAVEDGVYNNVTNLALVTFFSDNPRGANKAYLVFSNSTGEKTVPIKQNEYQEKLSLAVISAQNALQKNGNKVSVQVYESYLLGIQVFLAKD
ncbi:hypothetical protein F9K73_10705 [Brucella intermedia]|uniref:hypothetical protein n=1 Tax=Brucella intermedia TaxID=94625 RepID=UPI00124F5E67|nr:hypothetical protein [Brucella intermedia]KAB2721318.1 hypothetical protein F9K73_10705 [Brucella intermedia]